MKIYPLEIVKGWVGALQNVYLSLDHHDFGMTLYFRKLY